MNRIGRFDYQKYGPLIALSVLVLLSAVSSKHFLQVQNIVNILRQVSFTGIIALAMTFVIIAGGIDLSVGSMTALVGALVIRTLNALLHCWGPEYEAAAIAVAVIAGLAIGSLAGAANGLVITCGKIAPFIATLGTMAIYRSLTLYLGNAGEFRSESNALQTLGMGGTHLFTWGNTEVSIPYPVWAFLGLAAVFSVLLNAMRFGRYVCAIGANPKVAQYAAIRVNLVRFLTYVLTGFTVGVSSVFLASRLNSVTSTTAGLNYELDAIAAVIIGGTPMTGGRGSVWGSVVGAVILGIINNMLNMLEISPYLQGTVKGLVIIGAVLVQRAEKASR